MNATRDPWADLLAAAPAGELRVVRAPGRVNLIGEHTDYNDGLVLPMAINLQVRIASVPGEDATVRLRSLTETGERSFPLADPGEPRDTWIDYVAGVAVELRKAGVPMRAPHGVIASTLPAGAGLSSSAAIELAAAWALSAETPPPVPPLELARAAQRAENGYVGVQCGIMDQATVALARAGTALLLDCRSLEWRHVPMELPGHAVVVIDSGSRRKLSASAYNRRRAECAAAVSAIQTAGHTLRSLRDVTADMLDALASALDPIALRRARHVVEENARVEAAVAALEEADAATLGRLLTESHASLRDLYEVSSPQLDTLVELATSVPGVLGARLTGAGFGGSAVAIAREEAVEPLQRALEEHYPARTGLTAAVHVAQAADGVGLV